MSHMLHAPRTAFDLHGMAGPQPMPPTVRDLHFPEGIPGFPTLRRATVTWEPQIRPFFTVETQELDGVSFVCVEPMAVCPDYAVTLPDTLVEALGLRNPREVWLFSLVTLANTREEITANLMCPMVVNVRTGATRQLIRDDAEHLVHYRIWAGVQAALELAAVG